MVVWSRVEGIYISVRGGGAFFRIMGQKNIGNMIKIEVLNPLL